MPHDEKYQSLNRHARAKSKTADPALVEAERSETVNDLVPFTREPWRLEFLSDAVRIVCRTGRQKIILARLNTPQLPEGETAANARLMCSSQDLLDALTDALDFIWSHAPSADLWPGTPYITLMPKLIGAKYRSLGRETPAPTADQREPGTASSSTTTRASSNKKEPDNVR